MAQSDYTLLSRHPHLNMRSTMSHQQREPRATAQEWIANTAPKTTYGKYKNKLLPLAGNHFLRNEAAVKPRNESDALLSKSNMSAAFYENSDADDSPLSDAEPLRLSVSPSSLVYRTSNTSTRRRGARHQLEKTGGSLQHGEDIVIPRTLSSLSSSADDGNSTTNKPKLREPNRSFKANPQTKTRNVRRGRLPINELVLVPGNDPDVSFDRSSNKANAMLSKDPISSSSRTLLDAIHLDDPVVTPLKRKAQVSLSTIRKRLRTPTSNYKPIKGLRKSNIAVNITATGKRNRDVVGDGFEKTELASTHRSLFGMRGERRRLQRKTLLQGMQALTLVGGPLPDVQFDHCQASQLEIKAGSQPSKFESATLLPRGHSPAVCTSLINRTARSSKRQVSFSDDIHHLITAQLSSVSAPMREPSVSLTSEDDEGDEGGDEEESSEEGEDDLAADTYLDEYESPSEGKEVEPNEDEQARSHLRSQTNHSAYLPGHSSPAKERTDNTGVTLDFRRSDAPGYHQRGPPRRGRLNEVNETILDDFQLDGMLFENTTNNKPTNPVANTSMINPQIHQNSFRSHPHDRDFSVPNPAHNYEPTKSTNTHPRSILKPTAPQISSESNRPESTAANTRRNSTVLLEESCYFSTAENQLTSSSPPRQRILRKKSNSRAYSPIQIPYSDDFVPETSPGKLDHSDAGHLLRCNSEAVWTSTVAPLPPRDLRDLTKVVSRDNGTLSQSVRRRKSLPFQSPMVGH